MEANEQLRARFKRQTETDRQRVRQMDGYIDRQIKRGRMIERERRCLEKMIALVSKVMWD